MNAIRKISLIGAGNVAWHLGKVFLQNGLQITQVWSRTEDHARELGEELNCAYTSNYNEIESDTDLFIITVSDDAIEEVSEKLPERSVPVVHTSGGTPLEVLKGKGYEHYGIFYPLQTLSKNQAVDFSQVPLSLECSDKEFEENLKFIANKVSEKVFFLDSEQRRVVHVAAVFACNFSNYMYMVAEDILSKNDISSEVLKPLIMETAEKVQSHLPAEVQTGPAVRKDLKVIENHKDFLKNEEKYREIYNLLTENILKDIKQDNG